MLFLSILARVVSLMVHPNLRKTFGIYYGDFLLKCIPMVHTYSICMRGDYIMTTFGVYQLLPNVERKDDGFREQINGARKCVTWPIRLFPN